MSLHRNGIVTHGVLISTFQADGMQKVKSLVSSGEIWEHKADDCVFCIPKFVSSTLLTRCGTEEAPLNDHELAARVKVLKQIRDLERAAETEYNEISSHLQKVYHKHKSSNRNKWSRLTTSDVVREVKPGYTAPIKTQLAVHKHLMSRHSEFLAHPLNFLVTQVFFVRPQAQVDNLHAISQMVLRRDPRLDNFANKVRPMISSSRTKASQSWFKRPSVKQAGTTVFGRDDLAIIQFLQNSIESKRSYQMDPFIVPAASILKKIGFYEGNVGPSMINELLMDLGVVTRWDDPVSRYPDLVIDLHHGKAERTLASTAQASSPALQSLSRDDLYPSDIVASLRHDFGDLPVYVVDDATAEELDDGLSIEPVTSEPGTFWLHIHIADPTAILPPTHKISLQAHRISATTYLPDRTIPMLPSDPIFAELSLGSQRVPGQAQNVLTFSVKVDAAGTIQDYQVRPGVVRNITKFTYDDANAAIGDKLPNLQYPFGGAPDESPEIKSLDDNQIRDLRQLKEVTNNLASARLRTNALSVFLHRGSVSIAPKPLPPSPAQIVQPMHSLGFPTLTFGVETEPYADMGARRIVAECAKVACRVASMFFRDRNLPAIRRGMTPPQLESETALEELLPLRDHLGFIPTDVAFRHGTRLFVGGTSTLETVGHWALGIPEGEGYVRATSPLRRYSDMVMHWQIKHALLGKSPSPLFSQEWMADFLAETRIKEQRQKKQSNASAAFWNLKFIERWRENPDDDIDDPLQSLVAQRINPYVIDPLTKTSRCDVYIPSLGMKAFAVGVHKDEETALVEPFAVNVKEVELGLRPKLIVSRK